MFIFWYTYLSYSNIIILRKTEIQYDKYYIMINLVQCPRAISILFFKKVHLKMEICVLVCALIVYEVRRGPHSSLILYRKPCYTVRYVSAKRT